MSDSQKTILITGGAGFIGTHLLLRMVKKYPSYHFINLDYLTYAGNLSNLDSLEAAENYEFVKADIAAQDQVDQILDKYKPDGVIHLAAESHVDRSIADPMAFVKTNVLGTIHLLNACKRIWEGNYEGKRFYHVSTDEVYGSLGPTGLFLESTAYDPRSPYSASKASSDHFVRAYSHTYGLPVVISNCSNNYGPYQFPEKLLPLFINNIKHEKELPVYGDGKYTRDWLWVGDHAAAIDSIFHEGRDGETYNIGSRNEWQNIELIHLLCKVMDEQLNRPEGSSAKLITFVKDRPGHDKRYAIDSTKLENELNWKAEVNFEEGLGKTVAWYLSNEEWMNNITSGAYQQYYDKQYKNR